MRDRKKLAPILENISSNTVVIVVQDCETLSISRLLNSFANRTNESSRRAVFFLCVTIGQAGEQCEMLVMRGRCLVPLVMLVRILFRVKTIGGRMVAHEKSCCSLEAWKRPLDTLNHHLVEVELTNRLRRDKTSSCSRDSRLVWNCFARKARRYGQRQV